MYKISRLINYPLIGPISLNIPVTNICYSRCKSCNIWKLYLKNPKLVKKELNSEEWKKILKNLSFSPIWVTVSGGEPLMKKDIEEIIDHIINLTKIKYLNLATSGLYPRKTERLVSKILSKTEKKGITVTVNLSLDEINEEYEKVRGIKGGFEKVKKTIFLLKKLKRKYKNFVIGTNIVLSRYNYKRFKTIYKYIEKELSPDSIVSEIGAKRAALFFNEDISLDYNDYENNINFLIREKSQKTKESQIISFFRKKYYSIVKYHLKNNKKLINCYAGIASCDISSYGDIWNCATISDSMGNLRDFDYSFMKVVRSKQAMKVRKKIKNTCCFCNTANPYYTNMMCDSHNFIFLKKDRV